MKFDTSPATIIMNPRTLALIVFSILVAWTSSQAETPAESLMKQIGFNCSYYVKPLAPPIEDGSHDLLNFRSGVEYLQRDLKELQALDPNAAKSRFEVKGKPFSQLLLDAQATIEANEKLLASRPIRTQRSGGFDPLAEDMRRHANAASEDSAETARLARVNEYAKAAREAASGKTEEQSKDDEMRTRDATRKDLAAEVGLKGYSIGICDAVDALGRDAAVIDTLKQKLVFRSEGEDTFFLDNIAGEYAIYSLRRASGRFDEGLHLQIALKMEDGRFYREDTELPGGEFRFLEIRRFGTVAGTEKQVAVFQRVPRKGEK